MEWMLMPLKRYADFSGRSRRMEYWMWVLFQFLIGCVFWIVLFAVGGAALMSGDMGQIMAVGGILIIIYALYLIMALAFLIPNIAVTVRRLHDTNRSGWWILAPWGPYIVSWVLIVIGASAAQSGNQAMGFIGIIGLIGMIAFFVFGLVLLVFMFLEGTPGPNKYGPDPKGRDPGQVFS